MRSQIDLLKEAGLFGGDGLFAGLFGGGQDGGQSSGWARLFDSDMLLPIGMALLGAGGAQPYGQSRLGAGGQALMQGMQFVDRRRDRAERKKYRDLLTRREESDLEATEAKRGRADRARSQMLGWYHPDEQRYTGGGLIDQAGLDPRRQAAMNARALLDPSAVLRDLSAPRGAKSPSVSERYNPDSGRKEKMQWIDGAWQPFGGQARRGADLTNAQIANNTEIDAARGAIGRMGVDRAELIRRTQRASDLGRPNADFDPGIARMASTALQRKVGDDPDFQGFFERYGAPSVAPAGPDVAYEEGGPVAAQPAAAAGGDASLLDRGLDYLGVGGQPYGDLLRPQEQPNPAALFAPPGLGPPPPFDPTQAMLPRIPAGATAPPGRLPTSELMRRALPSPAQSPTKTRRRANIADASGDEGAVQIQQDFQAGKITKTEAKRKLRALGYK